MGYIYFFSPGSYITYLIISLQKEMAVHKGNGNMKLMRTGQCKPIDTHWYMEHAINSQRGSSVLINHPHWEAHFSKSILKKKTSKK